MKIVVQFEKREAVIVDFHGVYLHEGILVLIHVWIQHELAVKLALRPQRVLHQIFICKLHHAFQNVKSPEEFLEEFELLSIAFAVGVHLQVAFQKVN